MLTREHAIAEYDRSEIIPDRLTQTAHSNYLGYAEKMLEIYRNGTGKTRNQLHRAVRSVFENELDCPSRRINAFCKLLDDASDFHRDSKKAAALRKKVFQAAAEFHPLVQQVDRFFENNETEIKQQIAASMGMPWEEIDNKLFADVTELHCLKEFQGFKGDARELLSRYNVGQLQVALYRATQMTVWAGADFKTILRYAKLAKLMHTIERLENGRFRFYFDGPASVLRNTRRYGLAMAKFLPALLACRDWRMQARIATKNKGYSVTLQVDHRKKFKGHFPALDDFDSSVEETFAQKWGDQKRDGWSLEREKDFLYKGQKVFFPDFILKHEDGRSVYLEIVGYWTPEYLTAKSKTLQEFHDQHILVAVSEMVEEKMPFLPVDTITFKSALLVKDVLSRL